MTTYETTVTFDWKGFLIAIAVIASALLVIMLYVIPVKMANKRGRSAFGWFVFSIFFSPVLAMVFLAVLGETDEKRHERIREEETIRAMYRSQI